MKTPLAVIIGYAELVGSGVGEEHRIEASRMIIAAAERLSRELDELLEQLLPDER